MKRSRSTLMRYAALTLCALGFVVPVALLIVGSLKPEAQVLSEARSWKAFFPTTVSLENYRDVFRRVPFVWYLFNSLVINAAIVVLGLVVNAFAGYALARLVWPGRKQILVVVLALLIVPFEAIAVPLFYQLSVLGWRNSYTVQIVPFLANPLSIYLFYTFFRGLPPELEEAARVDGASVWRTFILIVIPNAKPVFATVAIVTFLFYWGMYLWPLLMTTGTEVRPLPLGIATFYTLPPLQWGDILAFGVMMVTPVVVIFVAFQRWFVQGVASTGTKL